jgi:hypothetical protein
VTFTETGVEKFDAGQGPCVDYAGTVAEDRTYRVGITAYTTGAIAGQVYIVGGVDVVIDITPNRADGPSYRGTYTEHGASPATSPTRETSRSASVYHLNARPTGTDGSWLTAHGSGHLIVGPDSPVRSSRYRTQCIEPHRTLVARCYRMAARVPIRCRGPPDISG